MAIVTFQGADFPPLEVPGDKPLSEALDATNSPVLFGCRTGVCGTCLIEVDSDSLLQLDPASESETELLSIISPGNSNARLACQLRAKNNLCLKYIG